MSFFLLELSVIAAVGIAYILYKLIPILLSIPVNIWYERMQEDHIKIITEQEENRQAYQKELIKVKYEEEKKEIAMNDRLNMIIDLEEKILAYQEQLIKVKDEKEKE